jgi:serine/threonine protein phosphatase PrpC
MVGHDQQSYRVAALTHRGAVREHNEDAISVDNRVYDGDMLEPSVASLGQEGHYVLIADGMGGHANGELASRTVLQELLSEPDALRDRDRCADAILAANNRIYDLMSVQPHSAGMGTTVVGVSFDVRGLVYFNVGDSRAYLHPMGRLVRLSHDDVPLLKDTPSGRRSSHLITQSLGGRFVRTRVSPHIGTAPPLRSGETILLCSDGLTDMVDDDTITRAVNEYPDPELCVRRLFELALQGGGEDNVSIILVRAR